jgi:hypothetical protein
MSCHVQYLTSYEKLFEKKADGTAVLAQKAVPETADTAPFQLKLNVASYSANSITLNVTVTDTIASIRYEVSGMRCVV